MFAVPYAGLFIVQSTPSSTAGAAEIPSGLSDTLLVSATVSDSLRAVGAVVPGASVEETGGVFEKILTSLPTDPASIFALLLLVGCTVLVLRFGLQKGSVEQKSSDPLESSGPDHSSKG